jgi:hypothetical protein
MSKKLLLASAVAMVLSTAAFADDKLRQCAGFPSSQGLRAKLANAVASAHGVPDALKIGFNLQMWATLVASDGTVCTVAYSGSSAIQGQWLASRVISAQKANTANDLSLGLNNGPAPVLPGGFAISTANLYSATQPGGSLYGLQHSNPVAAVEAYGDRMTGADGRAHPQGASSANYGTDSDPMDGQVIGGINVFGGGLGLYDTSHKRVGGVGVSGDTSCMDHLVAWYLRKELALDNLGGILGFAALNGDASHPDNMILDITPNGAGGTGISASGYGHPVCQGAAGQLPPGSPGANQAAIQAALSLLPSANH